MSAAGMHMTLKSGLAPILTVRCDSALHSLVCRCLCKHGHEQFHVSQANLLFTGADDSVLMAWDTRCPDCGPVMSNRYESTCSCTHTWLINATQWMW